MPLFPENSQSPEASSGSEASPKVDLTQMFVLIEGILPFEACLYYQVLPLSIEGSCLNLGMVNPQDQAAADYARRLVSYINCSILPRQITSDWHREILSKYLSHAAKHRQSETAEAHSAPPPTDSSKPQDQVESHRSNAFQEFPTLVVNAPTDLQESELVITPTVTAAKVSPNTVANATTPANRDTAYADTLIETTKTAVPTPLEQASKAPPPLYLELQDHSANSSIASLQTLSPKALTQALLNRVISEGIGRLYLERQADFGRILWSKDGVLQSVLDEVKPEVFQSVINELKLLLNLSLIPVRKSKQIEVERSYENQRILLRFRVMPGNYGEEATLQILRGAALKFYQQQQIEKLSRDALGIAHSLQQRLTEIREQARHSLSLELTQSETFPAISSLLKQIEQQIDDMMT